MTATDLKDCFQIVIPLQLAMTAPRTATGRNIRQKLAESLHIRNMEYFSESSSQYYFGETEFWQHPYGVENPGLLEPYLPTGAYASLYDPMPQTAANFAENPAMETTAACVFPSTNSELMQLESNVRVAADTANDSWMKELNTVEEFLCQKSSETEYNMDLNVNSSSITNERQQIIEGSSFESPYDGSTGANIPIQDVTWDQAPEIMGESDYWRANSDLERYSIAPATDIGSSQEAIRGAYYGKCKCRMVKRRRRKRLPSLNFASLIDNELLSVGDKASYMNKRLKRVSKQGWITREGIQCGCCSKVYNISMFEAHAGSSNHRPAANIFLEDGRCLMDLQVRMLQNQ